MRASVTEEDAVRGVLKGADARLHIRTFKPQNSYFCLFVFANHPARFLVNDACNSVINVRLNSIFR